MIRRIQPSPIRGSRTAPPSKSVMIRTLAAALLAEGASRIENPTFCDDARAALDVIRQLGATVTETADAVDVTGGLRPTGEPIHCGESGLAARLFTPIAALSDRPLEVRGTGTLLRRPMGMVVDALNHLGATCSSHDGRLPIQVQGPLRGGWVDLDAGVSSQTLTGLLLALPRVGADSVVRVSRLVSRPYVELTLAVLESFGVTIRHECHRVYRVRGNQSYKPGTYRVEGDWSGAAFLLVAGAVAGQVVVTGLDLRSNQADRVILDAFALAGVTVLAGKDAVMARRSDLRAFRFDARDCPDLIPPLVALAVHCPGTSVIQGVERLASKESPRADSLMRALSALGADIAVEGDTLIVRGSRLRGGTIDPARDHRIAMAAAVAGLAGHGEVIIGDAQCVTKSYPAFFEDLSALGARVKGKP